VLKLKQPHALADEAYKLASSFELVRYSSVLYLPEDYEDPQFGIIPTGNRKVWRPLNQAAVQRIAADQFETLFPNQGALSGFEFMVMQNSEQVDETATSLLVRTEDGLRRLNDEGDLVEVTGEFVPNTLGPVLNTDEQAKKEVFATIAEWVDSEEDAHSLLSHLATALAPGYSAVKYVLLLGEGRNGKSLLMKMLAGLIGNHNVSNVTRQAIAEQKPSVIDLNGKLLNLVYDGQAEYLKDSGAEKTLIAGEPFPIRRLYESTNTMVQTNALFVEGLQHEPKSKDKSSALQKRLVRYFFPNVYPLDHGFQRKMLAPDMLGAFLALLIDHYVCEDELAEKLAPTTRAIELQLEHMYTNNLGAQFLKYLEEHETLGAEEILHETIDQVVSRFQSWRVKENDLGNWPAPDVASQLNPLITTIRKSARENGKVRKVRVVTGFKPEAQAFIDSMKGDTEDGDTAALVDD
jgi:phage/plasmid-associated DNA primase